MAYKQQSWDCCKNCLVLVYLVISFELYTFFSALRHRQNGVNPPPQQPQPGYGFYPQAPPMMGVPPMGNGVYYPPPQQPYYQYQPAPPPPQGI